MTLNLEYGTSFNLEKGNARCTPWMERVSIQERGSQPVSNVNKKNHQRSNQKIKIGPSKHRTQNLLENWAWDFLTSKEYTFSFLFRWNILKMSVKFI